MTVTPGKRADHVLRKAVDDELRWTPQVPSDGVGVAVTDGVVTLSGQVSSYREKKAASKAAMQVRGVTAIADEITVCLVGAPVSDASIAKAINDTLTLGSIPAGSVKADVHHHVVTLSGSVDWDYQRHAAHRMIEDIRGVTRVEDKIALKARPSAEGTRDLISQAIIRSATWDAESVGVCVEGTRVVLTGTVASYTEKKQAERAAWASPHVTAVTNEIVIE